MHCEHCQTTAADGALFCPTCGGKLTAARAVQTAADFGADAPTVALTVGPCESCGAPSLPGSTLCLPCTRAFESILGAQSTAPTADMPAVSLDLHEAATLLQPQAPVLPSAPAAPPVLPAAAQAAADDEPLADDEEYVDDDTPDDLMADEAATVLATAPEPAFSASPEWTPPAELSGEDGVVAIAPWARKGPDADVAPEPEAEAPAAADGAEPLPWWERNGQSSPVAAAKPEVARYVPPPSATPPAAASLESTVARQNMRPKTGTMAVPVAARASGNRSRMLLIAAGVAGIAAIGTPVMWKMAFADRPTRVSALQYEPTPAPAPAAAPRTERTHGTPAPEPPAPRVYQDLLPPAPEPVATPTHAAAAPTTRASASATATKPATKKPGQPAAPEPVAPVAAAPEPAPLLVATPPPVAQAPAEAAPAPPTPVRAEAVPLGKLFEISQVDERPQVTSRFEPVLPARLAGAPQPVVVIVRVLVSPTGRAAEASSLRNPTNDDGLAAAAVATVRQWTFAPAKKKGQPVSCWYNVGVAFRQGSGN